MKVTDMGGTCSTDGEDEECMQHFSGEHSESRLLGA
jgi:hypothetical protein